jgi:hypothetical protein
MNPKSFQALAERPVQVGKPALSITASNDVASESGQQPAEFVISRTGTDFQTPLTCEFQLGGNGLHNDGAPSSAFGDFAVVEQDGTITDSGSPVTIPIGQATEMLYVYPLENHTPHWTDTVDLTLSAASGLEQYTLASASPGSPEETAAGCYVTNDDLYAWLGNGSDNNIIQGGSPSDGGTLVPLVLDLPEEVRNGAQITLTDNAPTEADVYTVSNPGPNDQPILGDVNGTTVGQYTWTQGSGSAPSGMTTYYMEAFNGSANLNDLSFALNTSDYGAADPVLPQYSPPGPPPSPIPPAPPPPITAPSARSNSDTAFSVEIMSLNDPNPGNPTGNVSMQSRNWMVGQMVDLKAVVVAPDSLQKGSTFQYQWSIDNARTNLAGAGIFYRYTDNSAAAFAIPVQDQNDPGIGSGRAELQFFWAYNVANKSPEYNNVTVAVTRFLPGHSVFIDCGLSYTDFSVYEPDSQITPFDPPPVQVEQDTPFGAALVLGSFTPPTSLKIEASIWKPQWYSGAWPGTGKMVQLMYQTDWGVFAQSTGDGASHMFQSASSLRHQTVLDGADPYPYYVGYPGTFPYFAWNSTETLTDKPTVTLDFNVLQYPNGTKLAGYATDINRNDTFTDYLLFLPPGTNSQDVSLGSIQWTLRAWAILATGHDLHWVGGGNASFGDVMPAGEGPVWSTVIPPGTEQFILTS